MDHKNCLIKQDFKTGMFQGDRPRIYVRGRYYPGIPISRSFGDYTAHRIGVSSEPTLGKIKCTNHNEFVIIATSSLWNVMTPKEAILFVRQNKSLGMGMCS